MTYPYTTVTKDVYARAGSKRSVRCAHVKPRQMHRYQDPQRTPIKRYQMYENLSIANLQLRLRIRVSLDCAAHGYASAVNAGCVGTASEYS